ncbi:MAG: tetratricopeptide repeat protein, partial [Deltaproteobacteria bacterium]
MKTMLKCLVIGLMAIGVFFRSEICCAQIISGQAAPPFSVQDLKGQTRDLSAMKGRPMIILYFFDVDSKPSQEGLLSLNQLGKQYKEADLTVWAITLSPRDKIDRFLTNTSLLFPILPDVSGVSDLYHARVILPTVCIVGPGLKVLDYFQGGGKTTGIMLGRLAERQLQRKQIKVAKALSDEAVKKDPQNVKAKATKGHAALKEGNVKEAEQTFKDLSQKGPQGEVLGKEGLAAVYAKQQPEKALQLAKEVEEKAPDRAYVHVIKGDVLYSQGKKNEAEAEYRKATEKKTAEPYQEASRYNQLGRFYASSGQYQRAQALYDQAISIDPYYIEGTTNKGLLFEKEGKWDKALESYRQALAIEKNDIFAVLLAKKAQEMLDLQKDVERKKRMDQLVKDLAARYHVQREGRKKSEDTWTSQAMVLSFVD